MGGEKFILVTGASSGIGRAIALRLAATHAVIFSGRNKTELAAVVASTSRPDRHREFVQDLSNAAAAGDGLRDWLATQKLQVESLVVCAGVFRVAALRAFDPSPARAMMEINFLSPAEICRTLVLRNVNGDSLKKIVFVSSVAAMRGVRGYSHYGASKAALDGFMRGLALELAPRVRVNSVLPGAVETAKSDPMLLAESQASHPLGLGQPADVAGVVEFLLSDAARWITGQQLVVDGGWSCKA
jgi:NAD(P)-dependent dehydrogenase (short-subunit alcohol dehydrogenase family)